jgi:tRNA-specific 2-thiouridylase
LRAVDPTKDQSYVLHVLTQEKLARALFPVGEYPKSEIRRMAEELNLSVHQRPDSQDLCFLAGDDYRDFLRQYQPEVLQDGEILTREGRFLGRHSGLADYTIGQRKGLGLSSPAPLYVLEKDLPSNALIVGTADQLGGCELKTSLVNWSSGAAPEGSFRALVKIRYTAQPAAAEVTPIEGGTHARVLFDVPQRDITPGQAAVFYDNDLVVGGGLIIPSLDHTI